MTLKDDLFYACLNYCNAINHYKTTEKEMLYRFDWPESEKARAMDFEKGRVNHSLERLKEIINKMEDTE